MFLPLLLLLFLASLGALGAQVVPEGSSQNPWQAKPLSHEKLAAALEKVNAALARMPVGSLEPGEEEKRSTLSVRAERLKELIDLLDTQQALLSEKAALSERMRQAKSRIEQLGKAQEPRVPEKPSIAELDQLKSKLESQQSELENIKKQMATQSQRTLKIPEESRRYMARASAAEENLRKLSDALAQEKDVKAREGLKTRLENAEIEARLAAEGVVLLQLEEDFEREAVPVRNMNLEAGEKALALTEQEYDLYQKALKTTLEAREKLVEAAAAQKKDAVERARNPSDALLATWDAAIAEAMASAAKLENVRASLEKEEVELGKQLQMEKGELERLRSLVSDTGATGYTAERLKRALQRSELRNEALEKSNKRQSLKGQLDAYLDERFEVDDRLFSLNERWGNALEPVAAGLAPLERSNLESKASERQEEMRRALLEQRTRLTNVINLGQQLLKLENDRRTILQELDAFLLTQLVYIRDAQPLGLGTVGKLREETTSLWTRWGEAVRGGMPQKMIRSLAKPRTAFLALLLLIPLPALLLYGRRFLRRIVRTLNRQSLSDPGTQRRLAATTAAVAGTALFPLYLLFVGLLISTTEVVPGGRPLAQVLVHLAIFLFLWFLARALFRSGALMESQFGLKADTAQALSKSSRIGLLGYLIFFIPWTLLREPSLGYEAIARVFYTLFEVSIVVAVVLLVRKSSPLARDLTGSGTTEKASTVWRLVLTAAFFLPVAVLVMDVLGYRFGASYLAVNAVLSLATGLLLALLYRLALPLVDRLIRDRRRSVTVAPGEDVTLSAAQVRIQNQKFLRVLFILLGIVIIAFYWGIDRGLLKALDSISLYDIKSGAETVEIVSVRDVLQSIVTVFLAVWILKNLPGIYELALFPRFNWDAGIRYALLTMSRYGVLFIGILLALTSIHLDLSRIGLLMAALGVGLGFGLQEIVSNFVSGLILLVERPVRVNDIVSVGGISGEVKRINIRATTVVNWDRQEVIIPNKDFITKEVTNWTLADKTIRLIISVGVAYGSDIEQVRGILLDVASRQPEILRDPAPQALFLNHGDSALEFELRVFVPQPRLRFPLTDRLNSLVNHEFKAHGITIPFPQRDLHIHTHAVEEEGEKSPPLLQKNSVG